MLAGFMAVGTALVAAGNPALAASGPGIKGAEKTNKKAGQLLKAADELTNNDSPPRYGPGHVDDLDTGRLAQKSGAGAIEELQGGTTRAIEGAKKNVDRARTRIDGIFGKSKKSGDLADAGAITNPAGKAASDLQVTGDKVKSDISTTSGKVSSDTKSFFGFGGNKAEEAKKSAGDFVAQKQTEAGNVATDGKNAFDSAIDKARNMIAQ